MGARSWSLVLFSLCLFFSSDSTAMIFRGEENQEIPSYEFSTQLDSIPIVNPTTPGSANPSPTLNPTPPQSPDTIGQTPTSPNTSPTTPTNPYTNPTTPTNPYTNPTTPTNPYTNPTTPTNPYTNPTTPTTTPPTPNANPTTPTSPTPTSGGGGGGQWCVASQSAAESTLKVALDYACGYGADCSAIQPGASCYNPNTLRDHASYAFNDYYQKNPAPTSCAFGGTATLTNKDPSRGNCHFSSSKSSSSMSPPTSVSPPNSLSPPTSPTTMTPTSPTTMTPTPPGLTIPGGASVYGSAPTGSPNSATSSSCSVLLLVTLFGLWASLHVENSI